MSTRPDQEHFVHQYETETDYEVKLYSIYCSDLLYKDIAIRAGNRKCYTWQGLGTSFSRSISVVCYRTLQDNYYHTLHVMY